MSEWREREEKLKRLARRQELGFLIWGPSLATPLDEPARLKREKRIKMKETLQAAFPFAEVRFSEEINDSPSSEIDDLLLREAVQAKTADLVLLLDLGTRGLQLEEDHFVLQYSWFRDKAHIFLPREDLQTAGLVREVFARIPSHQLHPFTPQELEACVVASRMALKVAEAVAYQRLLHA
jgi:hypothetical protein